MIRHPESYRLVEMRRPVLFILVAGLCCSWSSAFTMADSLRAPVSRGQVATSPLEGTWLPQSAQGWDHSLLSEVRSSKLTIRSHSFALSKFHDLSKDVTGTYSIDPTANPGTIDLKSQPIDLSPTGTPVVYPAAALPGI